MVFRIVNAYRRGYEAAGAALVAADHCWPARLITHPVAVDDSAVAFTRRAGDVTVVLEFGR